MTFDDWWKEAVKWPEEQVTETAFLAAWEAATKAERAACLLACEENLTDSGPDEPPEDAAYNAGVENCWCAIRARSLSTTPTDPA